jgi:hypothetical protein
MVCWIKAVSADLFDQHYTIRSSFSSLAVLSIAVPGQSGQGARTMVSCGEDT